MPYQVIVALSVDGVQKNVGDVLTDAEYRALAEIVAENCTVRVADGALDTPAPEAPVAPAPPPPPPRPVMPTASSVTTS